jgi:hypothetical protein
MSTHHPIVPAHPDPIRIVPLHVPDSVVSSPAFIEAGIAPAPTPPPHLSYRGGPLLKAVEIYTIFWGAPWTQAPLNALAGNINQFFQFIVTSPLIDQMAEYSVPNFPIGHGSYASTITLSTPHPPHTASDSAIRHMLQQEISTNAAIPKPNPNLLYFVYLPPGVAIVQGGGRSCQAFCGYHDNISGQIFYAAMPYPGCQGCTSGLNAFDALTSTSSHEMCEAITDAVPGTGWYDDVHGEIGDICAWKTKKVGAYTVQLEWSNAANACV